MLRTNRDKLVQLSVMGMVALLRSSAYRIDRDGVPFVLPGTGGIAYMSKWVILRLVGQETILSRECLPLR